MNNLCLKPVVLFALILPLSATAQDDVKADVAISVQQTNEIWTGQQVTLNLDLKTTGFSFSNSHFNLPEVPGAFLMQTDTTTVKFSERAEGETWQIVRYPLALYPQKAGQLEIPSIGVRFITSAGFGSEEKSFEFQTSPLEVTVKLPPGVNDGDLVVTTDSFELDYNWQPATETAHTGDALTLTVTRHAEDISAMLLPPLPVYRTQGLAAYPQAPEVSDKTSRGDLTGQRIDSIIWVVEEPGTYDIPGIRFQWWDPGSRELKQQVVPGLSTEILPPPADTVAGQVGEAEAIEDKGHFWLLSVMFTTLVAALVWLHFGRKPGEQAVDTEKTAFATLQKACKSNHPGKTYSAIHAWIGWYSPDSKPTTLSEFARTSDNPDMVSELDNLQKALISPDTHWQGSGLLTALQHVRRTANVQQTAQSKARLAPLNPYTG